MSLENTLRSGFYFKMVPETKTLCCLLTFLHCMKWMKCKGKPASKWPPRLKLWKSESLWPLQLTSEQHTLRANQPTKTWFLIFRRNPGLTSARNPVRKGDEGVLGEEAYGGVNIRVKLWRAFPLDSRNLEIYILRERQRQRHSHSIPKTWKFKFWEGVPKDARIECGWFSLSWKDHMGPGIRRVDGDLWIFGDLQPRSRVRNLKKMPKKYVQRMLPNFSFIKNN